MTDRTSRVAQASRPNELRVHTADPVLDYFLLAGPTPADVVAQLAALCGTPPIPPPWALGFRYHTQHSIPQHAIEAAVANFSAHGVPLSHVVIENYDVSGQAQGLRHHFGPSLTES